MTNHTKPKEKQEQIEEQEQGNNVLKQDDEEEEDEDDCFFESFDRVPSGVSFQPDFPSSGSDEDEEADDVRMSFASAISTPHNLPEEQDLSGMEDNIEEFDYNVWMEEPISVQERRRRLLQGMGLNSGRRAQGMLERVISQRVLSTRQQSKKPNSSPSPSSLASASPSPSPSPAEKPIIMRCQSDSHFLTCANGPRRSLSRVYSSPPSLLDRNGPPVAGSKLHNGAKGNKSEVTGDEDGSTVGSICRIKNLDTGKEFVVSEYAKDGTWDRLNDIQTGLQLTFDEFDKCLGYSPVVKQLMRRSKENAHKSFDLKSTKSTTNRKKGNGWLKNIKFVASSVTGLIMEKDKLGPSKPSGSLKRLTLGTTTDKTKQSTNERLKVHQCGKSYRELTGLYMCQEVKAHEGPIWCMKFCNDGKYLASAGEDRVIHVWQISSSESNTLSTSLQSQDAGSTGSLTDQPVNGSLNKNSGSFANRQLSKKMSKAKSRKKEVMDHIVFPETVVSLNEKPVCSLEGHSHDVLDLSWSNSSQYILSSSMDKTVRMWDIESKSCVKRFAHNDYVTCVHFNPVDERYFMSGSLDAKVRIWSVPDRQVVDWTDLHEMVTAASYTPDANAALVGSHKGCCRFFTVADGKLNQEAQVEVKSNKRKATAKKITGFQFAPENPSEVLITSADSQIRVFDGVNMINKFRGFKNTTSQIAASYTPNGRYIVAASEDSHVYIWKRESRPHSRSAASTAPPVPTPSTSAKPRRGATTRSHEHFYCKDVSVAIPWPGPTPTLPTSVSNNGSTSNQSSDASECNEASNQCTDKVAQLPPLPPTKKDSSDSGADVESDSSRDPATESKPESSGLALSSPLTSVLSSPLNSVLFSPITDLGGSWRRYTSKFSSGQDSSKEGAWGLVVVTASMAGDIRVYQNFGLPVRLNRSIQLG